MTNTPPKRGPLVDVGLGIVLRKNTNKTQTNQSVAPDPLSTHEILITRRPADTVYGGFWEIPGGKLHPGETIDDCVARELFEEVGVEVRITGALPEVVHHYEHASVRLHPRLCALTPDSPQPRALQVESLAWCAPDRLVEYRFPEANSAIIDALRAHLRGS